MCLYIKVRNKFVKLKYGGPNRFVIFNANCQYFGISEVSCIVEVTDLSLKTLGKAIISNPL